jgi:cell wall assembly regulator SMI1
MSEWKPLVLASPWAKHIKAEYDEDVTFGPPAAAESLRRLEEAFGLALPVELRSFLAEADGVQNDELYLVLNVEGLLECNRDFRNDDYGYTYGDDDDPDQKQPADHFFVISNMLGNGDFYAVCLAPVETFKPGDTIHWNHKTNRRSLVAHDLRVYIAGGNPGIR